MATIAGALQDELNGKSSDFNNNKTPPRKPGCCTVDHHWLNIQYGGTWSLQQSFTKHHHFNWKPHSFLISKFALAKWLGHCWWRTQRAVAGGVNRWRGGEMDEKRGKGRSWRGHVWTDGAISLNTFFFYHGWKWKDWEADVWAWEAPGRKKGKIEEEMLFKGTLSILLVHWRCFSD